MNDRVFGRSRCSKKLNNVFFEHNATKSDVHFGAAQRAKRAVVCLSRGGRNQPHTLKDTRPVPQVWGTPLFLEKPAHETGTISNTLQSGCERAVKKRLGLSWRPQTTACRFSWQTQHFFNDLKKSSMEPQIHEMRF